MLVHPQKMLEIAGDSMFTYWKSPDGYIYRAPANPGVRSTPGLICRSDQWEKIKHRIVRSD